MVSLAPLHTEEGRLDPFKIYARLHTEGPICAVEPGEHYAFVVHGHEASSQVLRDSHTFKVMDSTLHTGRFSWEQHRAHAVFMNSIFFTNAPRHTRMRKLFNQAFTPRRVNGLAPAIERMTRELLETLAWRDSVDFMSEFAFPLPANVLGELLGVPEEHRAWYRPRALALGELLELGGARPTVIRRADQAAVEITELFAELAADRRTSPRDDLLTALVQAMEADGEALNEEELLANLVVVFNAGFVTTTHLLGNGVTLLLDHPDHLAHLRKHPEAALSFVEEILRLEVPTHFGARYAAADATVAGVEIPKGSWVLVLLAAANRDPAVFADPDRFDPSRFDGGRSDTSLTFGAGVHYCLGAALARLEGVSGLNLLLERFSDISLARPVAVPRQLMLRGHEELWLHLS
jgi:cytochrome P450